MSKLSKILIGVSILLIGGLVFSYFKITSLQDIVEDKQAQVDRAEQNNIAYKESIDAKDDSLQNLAVFVDDLQTITSKWKNEYNLLESSYSLLLDSVSVLNKPSTVEIKDSIIIVNFNGKENKVVYNGKTEYDTKSKTGSHSITITREPIEIVSYIRFDSASTLRNMIYANGTLIRNALTVVDTATYDLLRRGKLRENSLGFFDKIGIFSDVTYYTNIAPFTVGKLYVGAGIYYDYSTELTLSAHKYFIGDDGYYFSVRYKGQTLSSLIKLIF